MPYASYETLSMIFLKPEILSVGLHLAYTVEILAY